jgi:hypothetical protein
MIAPAAASSATLQHPGCCVCEYGDGHQVALCSACSQHKPDHTGAQRHISTCVCYWLTRLHNSSQGNATVLHIKNFKGRQAWERSQHDTSNSAHHAFGMPPKKIDIQLSCKCVRAACCAAAGRQCQLQQLRTNVAKIITVGAILCCRLLSKRRYLKRRVRSDRLKQSAAPMYELQNKQGLKHILQPCTHAVPPTLALRPHTTHSLHKHVS